MEEFAKKNEETRRQKFERLATLRTNEILRRLRILGNCANRNFYEYTDKDIEKIFSAIEEQVRAIKAKFKETRPKEFKL